MTICIGVKVNDCIVFIADSASTIVNHAQGVAQALRVYNHADKIFNLYRGLPVVAMTCGLGNFGTESISTIAKAVRLRLMADVPPQEASIPRITKFAFDIFIEKYEALHDQVKALSTFDFIVGGYSPNPGGSEIWKFQFSAGGITEPQCIASVDNPRIIWAGQPEACARLVLGVSSQTYQVLRDAGLDEAQATELVRLISVSSEAPFLEPSMPVIDAIKLGEFLAQTTATYVRFLPGADTVGGELDIATVTKYEGFRWIRRKHFYPRDLNRENDHVH